MLAGGACCWQAWGGLMHHVDAVTPGCGEATIDAFAWRAWSRLRLTCGQLGCSCAPCGPPARLASPLRHSASCLLACSAHVDLAPLLDDVGLMGL